MSDGKSTARINDNLHTKADIAITVLLIAVPLAVPLHVIAATPATTVDLNGVVMMSSSNGWAVGDAGTTAHFDGFSWNIVASGTGSDLFGVSFGPPNAPNPNAGFAVGGSGGTASAIYWGSVGWTDISTGLAAPNAQRLSSVFALSASDAWAVDGVTGAFYHWTGSAGLGGGWSYISSAAAGLNSIYMLGPTDGWAVGTGGIIYHYSGGGWVLAATIGTNLNSVFMLSSTDGWAVGNGGIMYHFQSGSWVGPISPSGTSQNLRSVFMVSSTEGWAVGNSGTTIHYSGGLWTAVPSNLLATNQDLNSVYVTGGTPWAVGSIGTIVTFPSQPSQGVPSSSLQSVYLSSASDGWIVGCSSGGCGSGTGEPVVAHWNGASTTRGIVSGPVADLYSVFMVNSGEGWAVGGVGGTPVILHYMGGGWTQVPVPQNGFVLRSVSMIDSSNGWAVGDGGNILRYAGGGWGGIGSPVTNNLRSIFMLGPTDGFAVGDAGTILRYQSGIWIKYGTPTGAQLNSVFLTSPTNGWAVGIGGTILHFDGTIWLNVPDLVSADLKSVGQVIPQEAWAVGVSGTILRWNGISWYQIMPSPPLAGSVDLNSVFLVSSGFGLIVGGTPVPGSQGTVIQIGQGGTNPIPEFTFPTVLLPIIFLAGLGLTSHIRNRARRKKRG